MEISLPSFGSSQTLPLPHLRTLAASRFWSLRETISASSSRAVVGERMRPARVYVGIYTMGVASSRVCGLGFRAMLGYGLCVC